MSVKKTTAVGSIKDPKIRARVKRAVKQASEKDHYINEFKKLGLSQELAEWSYKVACDILSWAKLTVAEAAEKLKQVK